MVGEGPQAAQKSSLCSSLSSTWADNPRRPLPVYVASGKYSLHVFGCRYILSGGVL